MKTTNLKMLVFLLMITSLLVTGCKKDDEEEEENPPVIKSTIGMSISDSRDSHTEKNITTDGIINPTELTKCEITISTIQLKTSDGSYIDIMPNPVSVDLRSLNGTAQDLLMTSIPAGSYQSVKVSISGVSTTYEGNNYTASTTGGATVTLADVPGYTFNESSGVSNAFSGGAVSFEVPLVFTLVNATDVENVQLFFDAEASAYVVSYSYLTNTWNFAGLRPIPNVSVILEEGIQQIRHSPPMGINATVGSVDYYGIHTFVDFNQQGGTIDAHTSQHVYRGVDGTLLVDAEPMAVNPQVLSPNTIAATGESEITANETFNVTQMADNLAAAGHTLVSGQTYYFSLRKTWTITTNGQTYNLTRICEPIPVLIVF